MIMLARRLDAGTKVLGQLDKSKYKAWVIRRLETGGNIV